MPDFALDFATTPFRQGAVGSNPNRLNWRAEVLLHRNRELIEGKRVLDLACSDGRFSYACLQYGAAQVTGVEGRPEQVERGVQWFLELGCDRTRLTLQVADVFDYLSHCAPKSFDTILCFGFFYHTLRQVELMQQFVRLQPAALIMDTTVRAERHWRRPAKLLWRLRPRHLSPSGLRRLWQSIEGDEVMYFGTEPSDHASGTIERNFWARAEWEKPHEMGAKFTPTESMVERLFDVHCFEWTQLDWRAAGVRDWTALEDYRHGTRVSYVAKPREM